MTTNGAAIDAVLDVQNLSIEFRTEHGWAEVVDDVSFQVRKGETLGLVGESGSGKTVTSLATMGLLPMPPARITSGRIRLLGNELLESSERQLEDIRGRLVSMIFQEPMTSLNPAFTVGDQIVETIRRHQRIDRISARLRAVEMLKRVHIPNAENRLDAYPHEFSGGMRQRVVIAIALACNPRLLIADEPTTALDVTVQAQILELLKELRETEDLSILFITHDLGVVADICDRVLVMYAGQVVELGGVDDFFDLPHHPYSEGLLRAVPQLEGDSVPVAIGGSTPPPWEFPVGCRFAPRCAYVQSECQSPQPWALLAARGGVRCVRHNELTLGRADGEVPS